MPELLREAVSVVVSVEEIDPDFVAVGVAVRVRLPSEYDVSDLLG